VCHLSGTEISPQRRHFYAIFTLTPRTFLLLKTSVFGNISMSLYTGITMGNVNASVNVDAEKVKSL